MYMLFGVIFIVVGIAMVVFPNTYYELTQGWKNSSYSEPSKMFIIGARIAGVFFVVLGILSLIIFVTG